jgi:two-component system, NarL family, response regulator DevR
LSATRRLRGHRLRTRQAYEEPHQVALRLPPRPSKPASPAIAPPSRTLIRVVHADESELFRLGVRTTLLREADPPIEIVGEAETMADAVRLCLETKPAVVLLDMRFPDGTAADVCRAVLGLVPGLNALVLTSHSADLYVYEAVTAGVRGYLMKNVRAAMLVSGIRAVAAGRSILDPEATMRVVRLLKRDEGRHDALSPLSHQERRVLALVAQGLTNQEIGQRLGLAKNTVKNYLISVFKKLKVSRRAQAAALYVQTVDSRAR